MTGEKNRFSTTEKLWNLDDKQLTTPKHDELVLSITKSYLLSAFPEIKEEFTKVENWNVSSDLDLEIISEETARIRGMRVLTKTVNGFSYKLDFTEKIIDYVEWRDEDSSRKQSDLDLINNEASNQIEKNRKEVELYKSHIFLIQKDIQNFELEPFMKISYEIPIVGYNKFIVGYWDIIVSFPTEPTIKIDGFTTRAHYIKKFPKILIEAKPYIDSFGAVIRQINTYKQYLGSVCNDAWDSQEYPIVCLLTPDIRFKEQFESQDIRVI